MSFTGYLIEKVGNILSWFMCVFGGLLNFHFFGFLFGEEINTVMFSATIWGFISAIIYSIVTGWEGSVLVCIFIFYGGVIIFAAPKIIYLDYQEYKKRKSP